MLTGLNASAARPFVSARGYSVIDCPELHGSEVFLYWPVRETSRFQSFFFKAIVTTGLEVGKLFGTKDCTRNPYTEIEKNKNNVNEVEIAVWLAS